MRDDVMPGVMRRLIPSENDISSAWKETLNTENNVDIKKWKANGAPGLQQARANPALPPAREELLKFAQSVGSSSSSTSWKRLLTSDPEAAEAMKTVRRRVDALLAQGRAAVEMSQIAPDSGTYAINARGYRPNAFATSKLNPLEATELGKGWDPRAREWTGRQGLTNLPQEQTSLWCAQWAASASNVAVDQDFQHVQPPRGDPKLSAGLHTRGWR